LTVPGSKELKNLSIDEAIKIRRTNYKKKEKKSSLISKNYQTEINNEMLDYSEGIMLPLPSNSNNLKDIPKLEFINQFVSYSKIFLYKTPHF
jgi:hypothetical protein